MRLDYGKTLTLGLGFLAISMTWSVYNSFVPVFYARFVHSSALIGLLMTIDNIIGVVLSPWVAYRSDKTWNRFGRRMPYILLGCPIGALFFALIPFHTGLWPLLVTTIGMNLAVGFYRAPAVALMPDITPRPLRSQANGIINLMGGVGAVAAYFIAAPLFRQASHLPFVLTAAAAVIAVSLFYLRIREPRQLTRDEAVAGATFLDAVRSIFRPSRRGALYLLLAIFAYFIGHQGVESFFTLYAVRVLGVDAAAGAFTFGFLAVSFIILAVPAGLLAARFGRRRCVQAGVLLLLGVFLAVFATRSVQTVRLLFLMGGGLAWALVNVNAYPMLVEMASDAETGTFTGLYYFFQSAAAVSGPPLIGLLKDLFGYQYLFLYCAIPMVAAFWLVGRVRGGEAPAEASSALAPAAPGATAPSQ